MPSPDPTVTRLGILAALPGLVAIVPLLVYRFPNKLTPKVPNNVPRSPPFCSFTSFLIVWLTLYINKPDFSSDSIICMISLISSLAIINIVLPDLNIFILVAAYVTDAAAVDPNGIKTPLANGLSIFPAKGNPVFSNCPESLPKNPLDYLFYFMQLSF